ncbi:Imm51 family immunity protein [Streptomyces sp. CA-181903]|uniref:Imm51 family immunity protein n=1 Tax=Streptomyces sp. CA-181903 TaxID=3240055 RepID=UPI003D93281F
MSITLHDSDGVHSLTRDAGGLIADAAATAVDHEPNGYFWAGLVRFAWPYTAERLVFDSEAGSFCAAGSPSDLARLKAAVESVITRPRQCGTSLRCRASSTNSLRPGRC